MENQKDKAYHIIKDKIINCEFKPNEFISELGLMKQIEIGRTPIREALNKLEEEHLIKIIPKKGTLVTGITYSEIKDVYEVRMLIEPYILRNYMAKIDRERILKFKEDFERIQNRKSSRKELYEMDDKFHWYLMECSQNTYYIRFYNAISSVNKRIRILSGELDEKRIDDTYKEHMEIINGLVQGNCEDVARAMECHITNSREAGLKSFMGN